MKVVQNVRHCQTQCCYVVGIYQSDEIFSRVEKFNMVHYNASFDKRNSGTEGLVEAGTTTSMFAALTEWVVAKL